MTKVPRPTRRPGLPARDTPIAADGRRGGARLRASHRRPGRRTRRPPTSCSSTSRELTTLADYLVICSGGSERQLGAIADGIVEGLKADGTLPIGREGLPGAHWVLLDFGAVIVHVFAPPERDYYDLEKLWADAPTLLRVQ